MLPLLMFVANYLVHLLLKAKMQILMFSGIFCFVSTFAFDFWCRLLGTPSEKQWPGVSSLRDWHVYPQWEPQNLARAVPSLGADGVDLLLVI